MEKYSTLFLEDSKRTIDFVLVYQSTNLSNEGQSKLEFFMDNLVKAGLVVEVTPFTTEPKTYFVKIHIPKEVAVRFADIFGIDLSFNRGERPSHIKVRYRFMGTPITLPDKNHPIYPRLPASVSDELPKDVISSEKIMIVYKILSRAKFGFEKSDYGIQKLLKDKIFTDAFSLHDGPYEWTESGPLTERQLLSKFWGSFKCWYKEQPLNLIEKYFGTEMAFYFAWLGLYLKMLIPAAILSFLCVCYGLVTITTHENMRSEEICNSTILLCPKCHYKHCKMEELANSCFHSHVAYLFDNPATIAFAIAISFWSTVFMELWERNEAILQLEWNVKYLEHDVSMRPEYVEAAVIMKKSPITGQMEPYTSRRTKIAKYTITIVSVILLLVIMVLGIFGVMMYRLTVSLIIISRDEDEKLTQQNTQLIAVISGSFISVCFIFIFKTVYAMLALWLTKFENHRTQHDFDYSYIYKSYALAFTNNYAVVLYIAFFKGRFFTHPGDVILWKRLGGIASDLCDPTGCIIDLGVQLTFIMIIRLFVNNFSQFLLPLIQRLLQRRKHKVVNFSHMPLYEQDYMTAPLDEYYLVDEYMDMVIQYGFVIFFVVGFPLAPLLAFLNNLVEMRVDASKMIRHFRRPVPKRVAGIGAWMGILQAITYLGVVTNAVVIAFTSDFVPMEIYRYETDFFLRGFIHSKISAYDRADINKSYPRGSICYYPGRRYPPDHPNKYHLTADYWFLLAIRFLVVIIFEHIVMLTNGIIAYAIPDVPAHVKERIAIEERKNKEMRIAALDEDYDYKKKRSSILGLISVR